MTLFPLVMRPVPRRDTELAHRPDLRLVADPGARRVRKSSTLSAGAAAVVVCAGLFLILALRVVLSQGQAEVDALETRVAAERSALRTVRLEVARLESPDRIESQARTRLGMVRPGVVVSLSPPSGIARGPQARP